MLEKLEEIPKSRRFALYAIIPILVVVLFWNLFYSPTKAEVNRLKNNLKQEKRKLEKLKLAQKRLNKLNKEIKEIRQKFLRLSQLLPEEKEIPDVLSDVNALGNDTHLDFLLFEPQKEVAKNFYAEVPIRLLVEGEYLSVKSFLERISQLPRVVNVSKLNLGKPKVKKDKIILKAEMQLVTYRFLSTSKSTQKKGRKR